MNDLFRANVSFAHSKHIARSIVFLLAAFTAVIVRAQVPPITIEHDVAPAAAGAMTSDRFTWRDSANKPRVAVLAHNDGQVGPGGSRGGELREFDYQVGASTRVVAASSSGAAGFGYVVSHPDDSEQCVASPDTSPLGHVFTGTFTRVFEGRHHVIFRFTQLYPRYCTVAAPPAGVIYLPVTIEWVFSTGHDNPLWGVTFDLNGVAADKLLDDSRGPYGELLFDGSATELGHSTIAGVSWGDGAKFTSTSSPVTLNSNWSWNGANTIPYVKLWTSAVDATMGTVLTQPLTQQDAGGYWGEASKGLTSADGNACGASYKMPCDYNWPYQSINYSFARAANGIDPDPNASTNNTRLAWGTNFGFLGQTSYLIHGSAYYGGPNPDASAPGYPIKSYSTFIVLGQHSTSPVEAQVTQMETVQTLTITAATGTVVTDGPGGVGRADSIPYPKPGYNHVYGALAFNAAGNALDANVNVGAGTLTKPLIILGNYSGGAPSSVKLNNTSLVADVDYFASLRTSPNELWITLNGNLTGATNHIQITGPVSSVPGAPTAGFATPAGSGRATFTFGAPASDGGSPIQSYTVTCNPGALTASGPGSPITMSGMTNGVQYTCSVRASNINGPGPASGNLTVTPSGNMGVDFDGNTMADILWHNIATGQNYVYRMNGLSIVSQDFINQVPDTAWQIVGIGDFDGDGRTDILWRHSGTGQNYIYLMNGATIGNNGVINTVADQNWKVVGIGDFDGDGRSDILWRNMSTGVNYIYFMNGLTITNQVPINQVADQGWQVAAVADFNADGKADILWRHSVTGQDYMYLMSGATISGYGVVNTIADQNWVVSAARDFNADGRADILWHNIATGATYIYFMNGISILQQDYVNTVPDLNWKIVASADFNGDGVADILWRNSATGQNYVYLMNGSAIGANGIINTVADQNWKVIGK